MTGSRKQPFRDGPGGHPQTSRRRLRGLVEDATVDCYTDEERHWAFLSILQGHIACPFRALVVGEEVEVCGFDWDGTPQGIMAICKRKGRTYRVNATALEWAGRPPAGAEWFDAYRAWLEGNRLASMRR